MRIGTRLTFCFATILLWMLLGSLLTLWQLNTYDRHIRQLDEMDRQVQAILRVNNSVLASQQALQNAAAAHQAGKFAAAVQPIRASLIENLDHTSEALRASETSRQRRAMTIAVLAYFRKAVPRQIDTAVDMAAAGDWQALQLRLDTQVRSMIRTLTMLSQDIDSEATRERARSLRTITSARQSALTILAVFGLSTLFAAAALAVAATRSIARPLRQLEASARALESGDFHYRVHVAGTDELAILGYSHNRAAARLEELYSALSRSEAYSRSLIENASDLILVLERDGTIRYASPSSVSLLSCPAETLVGSNVFTHIHEDDAGSVRDALDSGERLGLAPSIEFRWRQPDGSTQILGTTVSNRLQDPVVAGVILNSRDITSGKREEAEIRELNDALERRVTERTAELQSAIVAAEAAKAAAEYANQAKTSFLAAVSHEIRTPMNAIFGMANMLSETELTAAQREYVRVFKSSTTSLLVLLNDLLDFAKIEAGRFDLSPMEFELADVIRTAVDVTRTRAVEKGLAFPLVVEEDLPAWVVGDPARLQQVLLNLLSNAVKFTSKGSVSVEVSCVGRPDGGTATVQFAVRDTGMGIPQDRQATIFQPFSQADASIGRRFGGTGLGLTISKALVEKMDGRLTVESKVGEGSTFRVEAPFRIAAGPSTVASTGALLTGEASGSVAPSTMTAASCSRRVRILAVDDVPENQFVVEGYLQQAACDLAYAADGLAAFEKFKTDHFDLVLMDIQMPDWDGYKATKAIREWEEAGRRERTPIVALSADYLLGQHGGGPDAQFDGYLTKPLSRLKLLKIVEKRRLEVEAHSAGSQGPQNPTRTEAPAEQLA